MGIPRVTTTCDSCGETATSWHGPMIIKFEREHVCRTDVAA